MPASGGCHKWCPPQLHLCEAAAQHDAMPVLGTTGQPPPAMQIPRQGHLGRLSRCHPARRAHGERACRLGTTTHGLPRPPASTSTACPGRMPVAARLRFAACQCCSTLSCPARPAQVEGGQTSTGSAVAWYRRLVGEADYAALNEEAAAVPPGCEGVVALDHFQVGEAWPSGVKRGQGGSVRSVKWVCGNRRHHAAARMAACWLCRRGSHLHPWLPSRRCKLTAPAPSRAGQPHATHRCAEPRRHHWPDAETRAGPRVPLAPRVDLLWVGGSVVGRAGGEFAGQGLKAGLGREGPSVCKCRHSSCFLACLCCARTQPDAQLRRHAPLPPCSTEQIFETMRAAGFTPDSVTIAGGATRSELWLQIHADVSNVPFILTKARARGWR